MNAKFPQILNKIKQVHRYYDSFTKNYLAQLKFMETVIRSDAKKTSKNESSFWWLNVDKQKEMIEDLAHKYNPKFCLAFEMMTVEERQEYMLELLQMIADMNREIAKIKEHNKPQNRDKKQLKKQILENLFEIYINKDYEQEMRKMGLSTYSVNAMVDGDASEKIIKFDKFMIHFVSKTRKEESKIILGMRNYVILKGQTYPYSHRMQSIYSTIEPHIVQIEILESQYQVDIIQYLAQVSKIGKIQNLVRNLEIQKIGLPQIELLKNKSGILSTVLLLPSADQDIQDEQEEQSYFSRKSLHAQSQLLRNIQRKQTLYENRYADMKKKLIQTLNILAEKKISENQKISKFLKKQLSIKSQTKSRAVRQALKCQQSILFETKNKSQFIVKQKQSLTRNENQNEQIIKGEGFFKIIGKRYDKSEEENVVDQSFMSKEGQIRTQGIRATFGASKRTKSINYRDDIYSELYPGYKISKSDYLKDYQKIDIVKDDVWHPSEAKISSPENSNIKKYESKVETKVSELQNISNTCKIYSFKDKKTKIKLLIKQPIPLRCLVSCIADITTWHKWHPNIQQVKHSEPQQSRNSCKAMFACKVGKSEFKLHLQSHFFKIENNYYLVMKSIPKIVNNNQGSSWSFMNFWKTEEDRKLNYLLIKMEKAGNQESSKMVIELEIDQKLYQKKKSILKDYVTIFLNLYFATSYWKSVQDTLSKEGKILTEIFTGKRLLNNELFQIDWQIQTNIIDDYHYWENK